MAIRMESDRDCSHLCGHKFHYFVLVLGSLSMSAIFSNMIVLNHTVIQINRDFYDRFASPILFLSVTSVSALATFPLSWLCMRYGAKWIFVASGVASALATGASPLAMRIDFGVLVGVRVIQGVANTCSFAVIGILCAHWASLKENGIFLGGLTLFPAIAEAFTYSVSKFFYTWAGWQWVHYFHAFFSLVLFAAWAIFYTDDPRLNRFVCAKELIIIHRYKSEAHKIHDSFIPYWAICKDGIVWTIWLTAFANLLCDAFLAIYAPTYIYWKLSYNVVHPELFYLLMALLNIVFKLLFGFFSDFLTCVTERSKLCLFNSLAMLVPASVLVCLCFTTLPILSLLLYVIARVAIGANSGGFYKCGTLVSRQYAGFVIAGTEFINCLVYFVAIGLMNAFLGAERADPRQWHVIFRIMAGALILSNVLFCVYATDEPRKFTQITRHTEHNVIDTIHRHAKDAVEPKLDDVD